MTWKPLLLSIAVLGRMFAQQPPPDRLLQASESDAVRSLDRIISAGLREEDLAEAATLALSFPQRIVPRLLDVIKDKWLDPSSVAQAAVDRAASVIAYSAGEDAINAVAQLVALDSERFTPLLRRVLNHAIGREREYEVAEYATSKFESLRKPAGQWLQEILPFPMSERLLAEAVVRWQSIAGAQDDTAPAVLALLSPAQRQSLATAVRAVREAADRKERK